jgi:hypothetical protein
VKTLQFVNLLAFPCNQQTCPNYPNLQYTQIQHKGTNMKLEKFNQLLEIIETETASTFIVAIDHQYIMHVNRVEKDAVFFSLYRVANFNFTNYTPDLEIGYDEYLICHPDSIGFGMSKDSITREKVLDMVKPLDYLVSNKDDILPRLAGYCHLKHELERENP